MNEQQQPQQRQFYSIADRVHGGRALGDQHRLGPSAMRADGTERQAAPVSGAEQGRRHLRGAVRAERGGHVLARCDVRERAGAGQHVPHARHAGLRSEQGEGLRTGPARRHHRPAVSVHGGDQGLRPGQPEPGRRGTERGQDDLQGEPERRLSHGVLAGQGGRLRHRHQVRRPGGARLALSRHHRGQDRREQVHRSAAQEGVARQRARHAARGRSLGGQGRAAHRRVRSARSRQARAAAGGGAGGQRGALLGHLCAERRGPAPARRDVEWRARAQQSVRRQRVAALRAAQGQSGRTGRATRRGGLAARRLLRGHDAGGRRAARHQHQGSRGQLRASAHREQHGRHVQRLLRARGRRPLHDQRGLRRPAGQGLTVQRQVRSDRPGAQVPGVRLRPQSGHSDRRGVHDHRGHARRRPGQRHLSHPLGQRQRPRHRHRGQPGRHLQHLLHAPQPGQLHHQDQVRRPGGAQRRPRCYGKRAF